MKEIERTKVNADDLKIGMYVSGLDRDWLETPFLLQGFLIDSQSKIQQLRDCCQHVFIDMARSRDMDTVTGQPIEKSGGGASASGSGAYQSSKKALPGRAGAYGGARVSKESFVRATQALSSMRTSLKSIVSDLTSGVGVDEDKLEQASVSLVKAAVNYPYALSLLAFVRKKDSALFDNSLRLSTWSLLCGREMGLDENTLKTLTAGTMMINVGQLARSKDPNKTLPQDKYSVTRRSVYILRQRKFNEQILSVVEHCFEKFNGTGKPRGLIGEETPLTSRIAGLALAYDALLYPTDPGADPATPMQASRRIFRLRGRAFQDELTQFFIESIGIYPPGTILQLNTGELAVCVEQPKDSKLEPSILIVSDRNGMKLKKYILMRLAKQQLQPGQQPRKIVRDLSPTEISIDLNEVSHAHDQMDYIDANQAEAKGGLLKRMFS